MTGERVSSLPKTAAGKRTIVLPSLALDALTEHLARFTGAGG